MSKIRKFLCWIGIHRSDGDYGSNIMGDTISDCKYCGHQINHG